MRLVALVLVLAVAALAIIAVVGGYVVWIRLVGLEPTLARRAAELPGSLTAPMAIVIGLGLGGGLSLLPSINSGLAAVVLLAASLFAGLLLFELYAARQGYDA